MTPTCRLIIRDLQERRRQGMPAATVSDLVQGTGSCESSVRSNLRWLLNTGLLVNESRTHPVYRRPDATLYRLAE